jgi:hypothetical protein
VKDLVVDCYPFAGPNYTTTITFFVPTVKVNSNGYFATTYEQTDDQGQPDGQLKVDGFFLPSGRTQGATVHYLRYGCLTNHGFDATAHGHNVVSKPPVRGAPVGGARYGGKTDQGYGLSLQVSGDRRHVARIAVANIDAACTDGTTDYFNGGWSPGDHVRLTGQGKFASTTRGNHVALNIKGRIGTANAAGTLSVHETFAGGTCDSGPVAFSLRRR